jgi:hypothetical protein
MLEKLKSTQSAWDNNFLCCIPFSVYHERECVRVWVVNEYRKKLVWWSLMPTQLGCRKMSEGENLICILNDVKVVFFLYSEIWENLYKNQLSHELSTKELQLAHNITCWLDGWMNRQNRSHLEIVRRGVKLKSGKKLMIVIK